MEREILDYLVKEKRCDAELVAPMMLKKVTKYADIRKEFEEWLKWRNYREDEGAIAVDGWTAARVASEAPELDGIGAFNFLVTLRDEPEAAQQIIAEKFAVK